MLLKYSRCVAGCRESTKSSAAAAVACQERKGNTCHDLKEKERNGSVTKRRWKHEVEICLLFTYTLARL